MTVHLLKLCVGVDKVTGPCGLAGGAPEAPQAARKVAELCHRTLQTPRRRDEVLDGGSLYWVIKGYMLVRQRVLDLRPDRKDDGTACCGIVLDPELVLTRSHPRRAFQGWRYLEPSDAPRDLQAYDAAADDMPHGMREDLRELRLIDW